MKLLELVKKSFLNLEVTQKVVLAHYMAIMTALTVFYIVTPSVHDYFIWFVLIVTISVLLLIKIITPSDVKESIEAFNKKDED